MNTRVCADRAINIRAAPGITASRFRSATKGDETLSYNVSVSLFCREKLYLRDLHGELRGNWISFRTTSGLEFSARRSWETSRNVNAQFPLPRDLPTTFSPFSPFSDRAVCRPHWRAQTLRFWNASDDLPPTFSMMTDRARGRTSRRPPGPMCNYVRTSARLQPARL